MAPQLDTLFKMLYSSSIAWSLGQLQQISTNQLTVYGGGDGNHHHLFLTKIRYASGPSISYFLERNIVQSLTEMANFEGKIDI